MGGGSSSSSSASTNNTQNTDKRLVVSDQAIGLSSDSSTVNITMADQGAIKGAANIAASALDLVVSAGNAAAVNYQDLLVGTASALDGIFSLADKAATGGFGSLEKSQSNAASALEGIFSLADKALTGGFGSLEKSQSNAAANIDTTQSKGTLDNRTITILGVSAAVAVAAYAMRK